MQNALVMYFLHKYVSPVCQETHKVSENITLFIFLRTHVSKNEGTTELIQICVRYDVISEMWAGFKPTGLSEMLLSETMRRGLDVIWSLFTLASIANTQS